MCHFTLSSSRDWTLLHELHVLHRRYRNLQKKKKKKSIATGAKKSRERHHEKKKKKKREESWKGSDHKLSSNVRGRKKKTVKKRWRGEWIEKIIKHVIPRKNVFYPRFALYLSLLLKLNFIRQLEVKLWQGRWLWGFSK